LAAPARSVAAANVTVQDLTPFVVVTGYERRRMFERG